MNKTILFFVSAAALLLVLDSCQKDDLIGSMETELNQINLPPEDYQVGELDSVYTEVYAFNPHEEENNISDGELKSKKIWPDWVNPIATNSRVMDIRNAFFNIPKRYKNSVQLRGTANTANIITSHVQGCAYYRSRLETQTYYIVTHNDAGRSTGKLLVYAKDFSTAKATKLYDLNIPVEGYNHAGGCQIVGDFLAIALENESTTKSKIVFYDLSNMTYSTPPRFMYNATVDLGDTGAGSLGITDYTNRWGWTNHYIIVGNDGKYSLYALVGLNRRQRPWIYKFWDNVSAEDCQGIGLIRDTDGVMYMLGRYSKGSGTTYADYIRMYRVNTYYGPPLTDLFGPRHMVTSGGGIFGPHFRWGTGIHIIGYVDRIFLQVTSRNIIGKTSRWNEF